MLDTARFLPPEGPVDEAVEEIELDSDPVRHERDSVAMGCAPAVDRRRWQAKVKSALQRGRIFHGVPQPPERQA